MEGGGGGGVLLCDWWATRLEAGSTFIHRIHILKKLKGACLLLFWILTCFLLLQIKQRVVTLLNQHGGSMKDIRAIMRGRLSGVVHWAVCKWLPRFFCQSISAHITRGLVHVTFPALGAGHMISLWVLIGLSQYLRPWWLVLNHYVLCLTTVCRKPLQIVVGSLRIVLCWERFPLGKKSCMSCMWVVFLQLSSNSKLLRKQQNISSAPIGFELIICAIPVLCSTD